MMSPLPGSKQWLPATVVSHHNAPRSYVIECRGRKYRRNRKYLRLATFKAQEQSTSVPSGTMKGQNPVLRPNISLNVGPDPVPPDTQTTGMAEATVTTTKVRTYLYKHQLVVLQNQPDLELLTIVTLREHRAVVVF